MLLATPQIVVSDDQATYRAKVITENQVAQNVGGLVAAINKNKIEGLTVTIV